MDLQTRKLNAIEYLIHLQDEEVFRRIEEAIIQSKTTKKQEITPMTQEQQIARVKEANADYLSGKCKSQEQLELDSEKW